MSTNCVDQAGVKLALACGMTTDALRADEPQSRTMWISQAFAIWRRSYLTHPADPVLILPLCRLFDISWTERSFLLVFAFAGPSIYALTALGLLYRRAFAGFVAWFIFIGPGLAEFTHFIFPLLRPALSPEITTAITTSVANGRMMTDMPNYWIGATHRYYFPGLYTAILPMIPGTLAIWRLAIRRSAAARKGDVR
jgi:hypothetical protein